MLFPAGRLKQRVTLQSKSVTRDAMGGEVVTWATQAASVPAEVRQLTGKNLIAAQQAQSEVTASILLRHRTDVQPDWRVLHGADVYTIHAIIEDLDQGTTNLQCAKGLRDG